MAILLDINPPTLAFVAKEHALKINIYPQPFVVYPWDGVEIWNGQGKFSQLHIKSQYSLFGN